MLIQQLLDAKIAEENNQEHVKSGKFSPSLFGSCYRRQYWNRKNEPKSNPPDARTLRVFKVGDIFHKTIQSLISETNPEAQIEVEIQEPDIKGFADLVLSDKVIELKTQHSRAFWHAEKEGKDISVMKPDHCLQVMSYCYFLGKKYGQLVYISKDDLCITEYLLGMDECWLVRVEEELYTLRELWEADWLPAAQPKLYQNKDEFKECQYCAWKDKCFSIESEAHRPKPNKLKEKQNGQVREQLSQSVGL